MRLLLDTHILIWAATDARKLSSRMRKLLSEKDNELFFSVISLWEIEVKKSLQRPGFSMDARLLRFDLLDAGYGELALTSRHVFALDGLPPLHRDPFDRALLCQAIAENMTLVTNDSVLKQYPLPLILT